MRIWHLQRFPQHVFIIPAFIALVSLTGLIAGMGSEIEKRTRREVSESLSSPETSLVILPGGVSCQSITNLDGTKIQLLPKLIFVIQSHLGLSVQHLICRLPDCYKSPCTNGNCEETIDGRRCVCPQGSIGENCEMIDPTTTTSATLTNRPSTSSPIQDATTLSASEFISTQITTTSIYPTTTTSATITNRPSMSSPIQDATTLSASEFISTQITTTSISSNAKIFVTDIDRKEIFVADLTDSKLNFMSINATREPDGYITHYSAGGRICWTYERKTRIYCADENGAHRMMTYSFHEGDTEQNEIRGLAVAEESHNLYMASTNPPKITYINIDLVETGVHWDFAWLSDEPGSLEVDDELGFLYWSMKGNIQRKRLMPGGGFIQTIYNKSMNTDLLEITGLSIDLSRNPRRIFFCDFDQIFYKDVTSPFNTSEAVEIAGDMMNLREIRFFNGMLYLTKALEDKAIAVLKDYEHANRSFNTLQNTDGVTPFKFVIVKT